MDIDVTCLNLTAMLSQTHQLELFTCLVGPQCRPSRDCLANFHWIVIIHFQFMHDDPPLSQLPLFRDSVA